MIIVIDPGHGGRDVGAIGPNNLLEKEIVLQIALKLGNLLKQQGIKVIYTRDHDYTMALSERAELANKIDADYFISIHANSSTDTSANGTEIYIYRKGGEAERLAYQVQKELIRGIKTRDRGIKTANFIVLKESVMPAILIEVAFISHDKECEELKREAFLQATSRGIASGIYRYLGIKVQLD